MIPRMNIAPHAERIQDLHILYEDSYMQSIVRMADVSYNRFV